MLIDKVLPAIREKWPDPDPNFDIVYDDHVDSDDDDQDDDDDKITNEFAGADAGAGMGVASSESSSESEDMDAVGGRTRSRMPSTDPPLRKRKQIVVELQQDNAPSHIDANDVEWALAAVDPEERILVLMVEQAANSPDTNINDLGFFASLQAASWQQTPATTVDGLVANVLNAYAEYSPETLNRIWLSHASLLNRIIESYGDNNFDIPHMAKSQLSRANRLPMMISLSDEAKSAKEHLEQLEASLNSEEEIA